MISARLRLWIILPVFVCYGTMLRAGAIDTLRVSRWLQAGKQWQSTMPDSAVFYYGKIITDFENRELRQDLRKLIPAEERYLKMVIEALNGTGDIYYFDDEYQRAETYYRQSLDLAQKAGFTAQEGRACFDIGYVKYKNNKFDEARRLFGKAYHLFSRSEDKHGIYNTMNACGLSAYHLGDYTASDSCFLAALNTANKLNDSSLMANIKINLGILYCEQEKLEEGIMLFGEAMDYFEQTGNRKAVSDAALNIGVVMKMAGEYERALSYILRSTAIEEQSQTKSRLVSRYYNLADLYLAMNDREKAYDYIRKTLIVAEEIASRPFIGECNFLLGKYYMAEKDYGQAKDYFLLALNEMEKNGDQSLIAQTNLWYAKALAELNACRETILYAERAFREAAALHLLSVQRDAARLLADCYRKTRQPEKALAWFETFHNASDSISYFEQQKEIKRIEARYNYEKKEHENELLRNKASLQEQRLRNRTITLFALFLAIVLSIVVIILLVNRIKYTKALHREQQLLSLQKLEDLTKELEGKERELTTKMMFLNQKNELIERIIRQLQGLQGDPEVNYQEINSLVSELRSDTTQSSWKEFETQFVQVHPGFYKRLYEKFPQLTSHEQRICAFLRINLNTKEIAAITGRSAKSIEVTRSRIRKKLGLSRKDNLSSFLASI